MIKNPPEKSEAQKVYHIFLRDECVLENLSEEKFKESWEILNNLVGILHTDYVAEDLSYEVK